MAYHIVCLRKSKVCLVGYDVDGMYLVDGKTMHERDI